MDLPSQHEPVTQAPIAGRLTPAEAKARLTQWAEEHDAAAEAKRPSMIPIVAGAVAGGLVGIVGTRMISGVARGSIPRRLITLAFTARGAFWMARRAISTARSLGLLQTTSSV